LDQSSSLFVVCVCFLRPCVSHGMPRFQRWLESDQSALWFRCLVSRGLNPSIWLFANLTIIGANIRKYRWTEYKAFCPFFLIIKLPESIISRDNGACMSSPIAHSPRRVVTVLDIMVVVSWWLYYQQSSSYTNGFRNPNGTWYEVHRYLWSASASWDNAYNMKCNDSKGKLNQNNQNYGFGVWFLEYCSKLIFMVSFYISEKHDR